jgi:PAS domain S-box-containing protein
VSGKRQTGSEATELRRSAEARLKGAAPTPDRPSSASTAEVLHELQVHQIELELQNEELRRARLAVEEARDRYLELYDFAPVGYVALDAGGRIASINLAGAALLGVDRVQLVARPFDRFVLPKDLPRWVSHLERVREHGAPQVCELLLRPTGREPFPAQLTSVATASDTAANIRCTLVDITERRRSEEEREHRIVELLVLNQRLEQTQLQLLQADKLAAIGQLAAGVAHEINNPLSYALSNLFLVDEYVAELLGGQRSPQARDLGTVKQELARSLAESREGLERVSQVVKDLKIFAHPDTGKWQVADLHQIVEGALRVVAAALGASTRLVRDYRAEGLKLRCRPSQLGQVFMNVLVNAAQANSASGTITVRTGRAGAEAWVEIEDSGSGILPEHMGRIFEPFFTTKPVGVGTGLGLSIAHGIVRGHGGRIEVKSEVGVGSTFRIVLPVGGGGAATDVGSAGSERYVS